MELQPPVKISFMKSFERTEPLLVDSTSFTTFLQCPRKYFYRLVLGFSTKDTAPYFAFGSAYHKFREILDKTLLKDTKADGSKYTEPEAYIIALHAALNYAGKHLKPAKPGTTWSFLTLERLKASCQAAFQVWMEERKRGQIKVLETEQPFTLQLPDGTWIAGRYDQLMLWGGRLWVRDYKTTSKLGIYYERSLDPNDQFSRYTYAAGILSGNPDKLSGVYVDVLYNAEKTGPKFEAFYAGRTKTQLEVWLKEHEFWMQFMRQCRETDTWPMNPKACAFCEFHQVCKAPTESGQMSQLKSNYIHKPWDCQKVEQEGE